MGIRRQSVQGQSWPHTGSLDLIGQPQLLGHPAQAARDGLQDLLRPVTRVCHLPARWSGCGARPPPASEFKAAKARADYHQVPFLAIEYMQPNWKQAPFDDVRVRQAFDLALNKRCWLPRFSRDGIWRPTISCRKGCMGMMPI